MTTVVIGAGVIGVTTAFALQSRGESVVLVDGREDAALETSFANGGLLNPSMPEPWNGPGVFGHLAASLFNPRAAMRMRWRTLPTLVGWGLRFLQHSSPRRFFAACTDNYRLATFSLQATASVTDELGLEFDRGTAGTLSLFREERGYRAKEAVCRHVAGLGMVYRVLQPEQVRDRVPQIGTGADRFVKGIHYPADNHGDARAFSLQLLRHFTELGGRALFGRRVGEIVADKGRIIGVTAGEGELAADRVVVAAGTRSPELLRGVGIALPVKPVKGYSLTIDCGRNTDLPPLPVIDETMHACLTPLGNRLRMVGTAEFSGFDTRIDSSRTDSLYALFEELLPQAAGRVERSEARAWAGLRPMSHDGRPFIGATSIPGLYVNTGHGPLGWTLAMGSAEVIAAIVRRREPPVDPTPFSLSRVRPVRA